MWRHSSLRTIIAIWLTWVIILLSYQAAVSARYRVQKPDSVLFWTAGSTGSKDHTTYPYLTEPFMNEHVAWDSEFYLSIATRGYDDPTSRIVPPRPEAKPPFDRPLSLNYAFFPVYPFLIRLVAIPLRGFGLSAIGTATLAGVIISVAGTLAAMLALYHLSGRDDDRGIRAAFYLITFPTSFFLAQVYTEGLFIGLAFSCLALLHRKFWFWAGLLAAVATLTRAVGVLLVIPLALAWLRELRQQSFRWRWQAIKPGVAVAAPLITYFVWKHSFLGNAFYIVEKTFFSCETLAIARSWAAWRTAFLSLFTGNSQTAVYYTIEFAIILLSLLSCCATLKRYPDLALFGLAVIAISMTCGTAQSVSRYVLSVPSIYLFLSRCGKNVVFDRVWTIASILIMGMLTALFTFDMWVG